MVFCVCLSSASKAVIPVWFASSDKAPIRARRWKAETLTSIRLLKASASERVFPTGMWQYNQTLLLWNIKHLQWTRPSPGTPTLPLSQMTRRTNSRSSRRRRRFSLWFRVFRRTLIWCHFKRSDVYEGTELKVNKTEIFFSLFCHFDSVPHHFVQHIFTPKSSHMDVGLRTLQSSLFVVLAVCKILGSRYRTCTGSSACIQNWYRNPVQVP